MPSMIEGGEMHQDGFKGFGSDDKTLLLNNSAHIDIYSSPHNMASFEDEVMTFSPNAEVVKDIKNQEIVGVRLPGVTEKPFMVAIQTPTRLNELKPPTQGKIPTTPLNGR